ncbi:hypothetical protein B0H19DRAFT_1146458, partial [Mycena capillaripes]
MSAPNYNPFCVIGIYRAPDHLSREEFEKNMAKLGHDVKLLPAAQNMLKLSLVSGGFFHLLVRDMTFLVGQIYQN